MAVDEVLLEAAAAGRCSLRFYRWQQPTLSLGYFQAIDDRRRHAASLGCPVVRRSSGGGAIVHDREVTYSVALPGEHPLVLGRMRLYQAVHETLIEVLAGAGIRAELYRREPQEGAVRRPFLCFQRRAAGDVVVGRSRWPACTSGGSKGPSSNTAACCWAARRRAGTGWLAGGVRRAASRRPPDRGMGGTAPPALDLAWQRQPLTERQRAEAAELARRKYAADSLDQVARPRAECR